LDFFADVFSKYWFVLCLALLVAGTGWTSSVQGRRIVIGKIVAVAAAVMILLGLIGLLMRPGG
jgi:hypothetical protein